MAQLDLLSLQLSLQRDAGAGDAAQPALLDIANAAPREVPPRNGGKTGSITFALAVAAKGRADNLGACRFRG